MSSTSETGHAKNVALFNDLITIVKGFGVKYNPSKESSKIAGLEAMHASAAGIIAAYKTTETAFNNATNRRLEAFADVRILATRVLYSFSTCATEADQDDLKGIKRKMRGGRAGKKAEPVAEDATQTPKSISVSQQSYDSLVDHFEKMIEIVKANKDYSPNEPELTVAGLEAKLNIIRAANDFVIQKHTVWYNTLLERNNIMYNPLTGLVAVVADVKNYTCSVYTYNSPQYRQLTALNFKTIP